MRPPIPGAHPAVTAQDGHREEGEITHHTRGGGSGDGGGGGGLFSVLQPKPKPKPNPLGGIPASSPTQ